MTSASPDAITGMGLEEVVRQMPAAVVVVEAASGRIIHVNDAAREMTEGQLGRVIPEELTPDWQILHADGRPYEMDEWPLVRSIASGEKVIDEEYFHLLSDGSRMSVRCSSSPIYDADGMIVAGVLVMDDITEQKRVEDELRYHAGLLENMEEAVIATDDRFRVTAWARGAERLYGWTADEVLGSDVREIGRSGVSDAERRDAQRRLRDTGRSRADLTRSRKDGTTVDVEAVNVAIHGERGEITGYLGIHRDISERKRSERALRDAQRRSETILESISDDFFAVDREWRYTYVNERGLAEARRIPGQDLTAADLLGVSIWERFPQLVGTTFDHECHRALREQTVAEFEEWSPVTGRWLEVHVYPSDAGLSIYLHDISERKRRAEQQALIAELGQRALVSEDLESLLDEAVALVARTLDVELAGVAEIVPGDADEVILRAGVGWREGVVGSRVERGARDSQVGYTLLQREPVISEDQAADDRFEPSALAQAHHAVSALSVMIASPEEPFGVLGALSTQRREFSQSDVTFVQEVANVLASAVDRSRAQERLGDVREAERRRIARDLHDEALQELTDALVEADRVRSACADPELADGLVARLKHVAQHLRGAIYGLRVGGDEDRPFPELVQALVDVHREMAVDCEVDLDIRDGVPTRPLGATGTEVLRVLGEALTNARRHSGARHVRVRVWGSERAVSAEVSDDGLGLGQTPGGVEGSGVTGMRERAGLIGGELDVRSEPDVGTSVRIDAPLGEDGEAPAEDVRVLLVEDHASVRQAIASAFEREADFEVVGEAASLAEAREMLDDVDVAVLDLGLPDGNGADLIKELRAVNRRAQALVLSATLERTEIARAVESGAAGVLNKTADLDEVVDAVRRLRAGETLLPSDVLVDLLRFAGRQRKREHDDRQALAQITPREREVLRALAEGLDTQRMADRLHISIRTARNHINNILMKLGVHSQLQALVLALRYDVVAIPKDPADTAAPLVEQT